ncbi:hypothetical protein PMIT1303_00790 [Prochlorococcus sp. MIT 1303]|nr:hypothetical protein PMIT1303_00790 [Prochlorococcus sp. MIT 1303]
MKTVLLGLIVALLWSSPQARTTTANGLRMAANWLDPKEDPKEEPTKSPKHITIPNPLYVEQE